MSVGVLEEQLARLATLSPAELRIEWARLWQAPAPRLSLDLLRFGIAYRLQEQAVGGLSERVVRALGRVASGKPAVSRAPSWCAAGMAARSRSR